MGEGVIGFGGGGENRNVHIIIITYLTVMQPQKNDYCKIYMYMKSFWEYHPLLIAVIVSIKTKSLYFICRPTLSLVRARARGRADTHNMLFV